MDKILLLSLTALSIDFAVCIFFGAHLFLNKYYEKSPFQKLFIYYFFLFALFILLTPFYMPGVVTTDPFFLKLAFLTDFAVLFSISVLILEIIFYESGEKYKDTLIPVWSMTSLLTWVFMAFTIDPSKTSIAKWSFWGFTPYSLVITGLIVCIPFALAGTTFVIRGVKEKGSRVKFILLGAGFWLIVFGGPLHQFGKLGNLFLLADFVTTAGFIAMFMSLVLKNSKTETLKTKV